MIDRESQDLFFEAITKNLKRDIVAYAFGGTSMMYLGYKEETKDIDILLEDEESRKLLEDCLQINGFVKRVLPIYTQEQWRDPGKPSLFVGGDVRVDVFCKKIFRTILSPGMQERAKARHDYGANTARLSVIALSAEDVVLLKAVTDRPKDKDDIVMIIKKSRQFDWNQVLSEILWQEENADKDIRYYIEEKFRELKKYIFVPPMVFGKLYGKKKRKQ